MHIIMSQKNERYHLCILFLCHHQVTVMGVRPVFEQVIKKLTRGAYPLLLDLSGEQTHCWGFYVR